MKKELREKYKKMRFSLEESQCEEMSLSIANQVLKLPIWDKSMYHIFLPIEKMKEIDTNFILHILLGKDKNVILPRVDDDNKGLDHFLLTEQTLIKPNKWGIPEPQGGIKIFPSQVEVVFVPLLAYDTKGNRLGYGKGFYDRFLTGCSVDVLKIGLSFFPPEADIPEILPTDIPLDYCVTPDTIYKFK